VAANTGGNDSGTTCALSLPAGFSGVLEKEYYVRQRRGRRLVTDVSGFGGYLTGEYGVAR
jgi:hypothetical protein